MDNAENTNAPRGHPQPTAPAVGYPVQHLGQQIAQTSLILGILSLFVVGFILGPIAWVKANKAERIHGVDATAGKVTGIIGTVLGALQVLFLIAYLGMIFFLLPFVFMEY